MSTQLLMEVSLISSVFAITGTWLYRNRHAKKSLASKMETFLTALLGGFLVMAATVKFFDPFIHMFHAQITQSQLPFPSLSKWAGQLGEMFSGVLFLFVLIVGRRFTGKLIDLIFASASLLTTVIMLVAVYVHLHPNVPAEVLPLQSKPPYLTLVVMMLVGVNAWLHYRNR